MHKPDFLCTIYALFTKKYAFQNPKILVYVTRCHWSTNSRSINSQCQDSFGSAVLQCHSMSRPSLRPFLYSALLKAEGEWEFEREAFF